MYTVVFTFRTQITLKIFFRGFLFSLVEFLRAKDQCCSTKYVWHNNSILNNGRVKHLLSCLILAQ
jgi:hypothetical protein